MQPRRPLTIKRGAIWRTTSQAAHLMQAWLTARYWDTILWATTVSSTADSGAGHACPTPSAPSALPSCCCCCSCCSTVGAKPTPSPASCGPGGWSAACGASRAGCRGPAAGAEPTCCHCSRGRRGTMAGSPGGGSATAAGPAPAGTSAGAAAAGSAAKVAAPLAAAGSAAAAAAAGGPESPGCGPMACPGTPLLPLGCRPEAVSAREEPCRVAASSATAAECSLMAAWASSSRSSACRAKQARACHELLALHGD